jgi:hypothetical protein
VAVTTTPPQHVDEYTVAHDHSPADPEADGDSAANEHADTCSHHHAHQDAVTGTADVTTDGLGIIVGEAQGHQAAARTPAQGTGERDEH